jgi:hypothetical protein
MSVLDFTAHLIPNLITTVLLMPFAFACVRKEGGREGVDNQWFHLQTSNPNEQITMY